MEVSTPASEYANPMQSNCPGRHLFELITSRWPLLILWSLKSGTKRFFEIRNEVEGISERVLSEVLKKLCRHGLIDRHVEPSIPPKVSYSLTKSGEGLLAVMEGLTGWIAKELETVERAKARYDARAQA
ncbi:helix-turn-helix transcriptional regulator [Paracoccus sp. 11-3]|uniref:Helix-turn-helix transcriptional regulator n=1 Tax=Paracoccus amoyensis TaxID=2760093 RepID=A0A926JD27_9RHOB|nr:helix-turn-helix domain-containing protein [Paracoccus amoyensis]MBC9247555.1 helix-turn-helix transcriptional regulator [Paracoccus amoyensis]